MVRCSVCSGEGHNARSCRLGPIFETGSNNLPGAIRDLYCASEVARTLPIEKVIKWAMMIVDKQASADNCPEGLMNEAPPSTYTTPTGPTTAIGVRHRRSPTVSGDELVSVTLQVPARHVRLLYSFLGELPESAPEGSPAVE